MKKKFQKRVEDFTCQVCGTKVKGSGYTDHCPNCLWSKHVDINPGDRRADCQGLMKPIGAIKEKGNWKIIYQCQKCGYQHKNKAAEQDNRQKIINLSTNPIKICKK